jgi:5-methyltetrahydropteroyltriglutamate--homocysteine methyltransferase
MAALKARTLGAPYDETNFAAAVTRAVVDIVQKQAEIGIDIANDGEFGRLGFKIYMNERLRGPEPRTASPDEFTASASAEHAAFPEFFQQYSGQHYLWMPPDIMTDDLAHLLERENMGGTPVCQLTSPVSYQGHAAIRCEVDTLAAALRGLNFVDCFMTTATPVSRRSDTDVLKFYSSETAYLYAVGDALSEEYRAITDAGFILQLDYAVLNPQEHLLHGEANLAHGEILKGMELGIEITNHALRNIPEEQVRYHHCWGSNNRPHTEDLPLSVFVKQLLKIKAQAYGIEAANPRHEHEWTVWKDVKLPEGKILIPGLISQSTNVVEHPELVASRIKNFASVVGKENVIAGTDCGFSQDWHRPHVHPSVQWAKLRALVDGAALATRELWRE